VIAWINAGVLAISAVLQLVFYLRSVRPFLIKLRGGVKA